MQDIKSDYVDNQTSQFPRNIYFYNRSKKQEREAGKKQTVKSAFFLEEERLTDC